MFVPSNRLAALCALPLLAATCGDTPAGPDAPVPTGTGAPAAAVTFSVDAGRRFPISRLIYGANLATDSAAWGGTLPPDVVTFNRMGGNRLSAYNWETNHSNAGNDYKYHNDQYLSTSTVPGEAVRSRAAAAFARGSAFMATVPMLPYVAGNACGCDVGSGDADRAARLARHFTRNAAEGGGAAGTRPDVNDGVVHQDAFVRWLAGAFPGATTDATRPLVFSLDNEPDLWHGTHKEVVGELQTYDGFIDTTLAFARAVKRAAPGATVFGPAVATYTGLVTLGRHPHEDPIHGSWRERPFVAVYLDRLREAEQREGQRLVDVFDLHWYPAAGTRAGEITNDYAPQDAAQVEARLQAPRSLWDSTYDERSWVSGVTDGPVALLPRLGALVAAHYPGTRLSVSEYYYGRAGDISGGVAQADVLGVFGREGVYAAALWPQAGLWAEPYKGDGAKAYAYAFGAFRMYLDYDGEGGRFGDTGLRATTSDAAGSSVYASIDGRGRVVVVAINKRATAREARLAVTGVPAARRARVYTLTAAGPNPTRAPDVPAGAGGAITYAMPPMSVSTLVLEP